MAKSSTTHSKYKSIIVSRTDIRKLKSGLQAKIEDIESFLLEQLTYIGEQCIEIARERGAYNDITGNLRSSIGYVVLRDGKPVKRGEQKTFEGEEGNGEEGPPAADKLLNMMQAKYPNGIVLIVCAGMKYAAYVEGIHHLDVLTSAELRSDELAKSLLNGIVS